MAATWVSTNPKGFPEIRGIFLGVLIMRTIVFGCLSWVRPSGYSAEGLWKVSGVMSKDYVKIAP